MVLPIVDVKVRRSTISPFPLEVGPGLNDWCRRRDLNPRPAHYECAALPLSYCGTINANSGLCRCTPARTGSARATPMALYVLTKNEASSRGRHGQQLSGVSASDRRERQTRRSTRGSIGPLRSKSSHPRANRITAKAARGPALSSRSVSRDQAALPSPSDACTRSTVSRSRPRAVASRCRYSRSAGVSTSIASNEAP